MRTGIVLFSASGCENVAAIRKVCGFLASSMNFLTVCLEIHLRVLFFFAPFFSFGFLLVSKTLCEILVLQVFAVMARG
jgi:hypothetical protein